MADDFNKELEMDSENVDATEGDVSTASADKASGKTASSTVKTKKKGSPAGSKFKKYLRDLRGEFKKIIWPTPKTVARNTVITLVMCAIVGAFVSAIDFVLGFGVTKLLELKKKA